jgi:hypothetical protein
MALQDFAKPQGEGEFILSQPQGVTRVVYKPRKGEGKNQSLLLGVTFKGNPKGAGNNLSL